MPVYAASAQPANGGGGANNENNSEQPAVNATNGADSNAGASLVIISGMTNNGKKFRPSDWCDRLHGTLRVLGDDADEASEYVQLINYEGSKCIMVQKALEESYPLVFNFFMRFAKDNNLAKTTLTAKEWEQLHA